MQEDISKIKGLKAQLDLKNAELQAIFSLFPDLFFRLDKQGIIRDYRAQSLSLLNIPPNVFLNKPLPQVMPPSVAQKFSDAIAQVREANSLISFEYCLSMSTGEEYYEVRLLPFQDDQIITIVRNISQWKREKPESEINELDSFFYSVSHDLRAPLRHISGFVNVLRQRLENIGLLNDPKIPHYLQVIEESSNKMGQLIDGLLSLSRIGRRELVRHQVDLRFLVENAIDLVKASANRGEAAPIEFTVGNLPSVEGDATLLQQVFNNLLDNAVKFSRDRHPIKIEIGSLADDTIFVRDNGIGFNMEYADQLFGIFQRLHDSQQFEGMGIGLSIVQRIIHRHGGTVWAESEPEGGATFYLKIPREPNHNN
jgi:signal transduction histidine kinase